MTAGTAAATTPGPEWTPGYLGPEWNPGQLGPEWNPGSLGPEWDPDNAKPGVADLLDGLVGRLF
ncbi:hypothetical protein [Kribbella sp. CA-247076]|uniref:hypothetical protein n=1 Tax=Kribbella sp. CA-247076 TaxID=3239941 RepID=UPI003D911A71